MKKSLAGLMLLLAAMLLVSCDSEGGSGTGSDHVGEYKVGETGPAGGIIFLVKAKVQTSKYTDDSGKEQTFEWKYLEAAPTDAPTPHSKVEWATNSSSYGTGTGIGEGWSNAKRFEAKGIDNFPAAKACADYGNDTEYDDWFLPSKDELNLMHIILRKDDLGSFTDNFYWSSSEKTADTVWIQFFDMAGLQSDSDQTQNYNCVRPIRAFK